MCSFPILDLDVQGELAPSLIATTGVSREEACDLFVLLDPRPFGLKPHFLFMHHNVVHLPTVIALLGISTSPAMRVGVVGGTVRGNKVHVQGNVTLLLFPEPRPFEESDDASSSSGSTPQLVSPSEEEALSQPLAASDDDWGVQPGATFQSVSVVDPSIPPGQGWNEDVDEELVPHTVDAAPGEPAEPASHSENATSEPPPLPAPEVPPEVTSPPSASGLLAALRIQALVYVPDYIPELVDLAIEVPQATGVPRSIAGL